MPNYLAPGVYIEEVSTGSRPIEGVGTSVACFIGSAPVDKSKHEPMWFDNWTQFRNAFAPIGATSTPLSQAVYGFFLNSGTRCCVVNIGKDESLVGDGTTRQGLGIFEQSDGISIVAAPGYSDAAAHDAVMVHCEKMEDRVAILDGPANVPKIDM